MKYKKLFEKIKSIFLLTNKSKSKTHHRRRKAREKKFETVLKIKKKRISASKEEFVFSL